MFYKSSLLAIGLATMGAIGFGVFGGAIGLSGRSEAAETFQLAQAKCPNSFSTATRSNQLINDPDWEAVKQGNLTRIDKPAHSNEITAVAFSPDGRFIVSGSIDKTVKIWQNWKESPSWQVLELPRSEFGIKSVAFSPTGELLADSNLNGKIRLWNWRSRQLLGSALQSKSNSLAFSSDGSLLVSAGSSAGAAGRLIKRWNVSQGTLRELASISFEEKIELSTIVLSPNGQVIAGVTVSKPSAYLWESRTGKRLCSLGNHDYGATTVAFSPDGKILATAGADKTIQLWSLETSQLIYKLEGHEARVNSIAFSAGGKFLVSGGADGIVNLWNVKTGTKVRSFEKNPASVLSVTFHPNGKAIAVSRSDRTIRVYLYPEN